MRLVRWIVLAQLLGSTPLAAQNVHPVPPPEVAAVRLTTPIRLDGVLDEAVWHTAPAAKHFRQEQPDEGKPATQPTEVRFAYDDEALYVGARMYDSLGAAGVRTRLVRRDQSGNADYLEVTFDTYHDHIGRLLFAVNPSGVRVDANGLGGGEDVSWDPVWEVKTTIDSLGWTAEMRIPFSQLRYPRKHGPQTWGLEIRREVSRLHELQMWAFWRLNESGGPSRFGHLTGLEIHHSPERAEILPYVVGRSANAASVDAKDPFAQQHRADGRIGVDARALLTSNLTLNATVNPDFGQVEVDPAVVNLSAFETYFEEKRPFFVEGAGYFGFGGLSCFICSNVSSLSMFYSRRIGRAPEAAADAYAQGPYANVPDNTAILGAAKLTGRTRSGWSIGTLDAVTRRENATVQRADGSRTSVTVQPFTNYFVGRVAKDLRGGATVVRAMGTSVVHDLNDPALGDVLSKHSEAFGLSTDSWFGKRDYHLMLQIAGSNVAGDTGAILGLQRSSARYFQRPDRGMHTNGLLSNAYDPSATSLRGVAGYGRFAHESGNLLWEVSTNLRSPGFENNDIAYLSQADYWWMNANVFPEWTKPTSWYRQLSLIGGGQQQYDFEGDLLNRQVQLFGGLQALDYWSVDAFWMHRWTVDDPGLTRGGPVVERPGFDYYQASISTDERKNVVLSSNPRFSHGVEGQISWSANLGVTWRPVSNVSLSLSPSYSYDETAAQYVAAFDDPTATNFYGRRYVFAGITQRSLEMDTRLSMTFSPSLTLELYVQPFIASGDYYDFKQYAAPRTLDKQVYGRDIGTVAVTPGNAATGTPATYTIDPDGTGPAASFQVADPSFTLRSLRGNLVVRWEYLPGSTLYLVWSRSGADQLTAGRLDINRDVGALFDTPSDNIFLLKVNYWLGL